MRRVFSSGKVIVGLVLLAALGGGVAVVWTQRQPLLSWYCVRSLGQCAEADQELWVDRLMELDSAGVDAVLSCLSQDNDQVCDRAAAALTIMGSRLTGDEERWSALAARLADEFDQWSTPGQLAALRVFDYWLRLPHATAPPAVAASAGHALARVGAAPSAVLGQALILCETLLVGDGSAEVSGHGRGLAQACLSDASPAVRVAAVRLAVHPELGLLEQVMPLLHDPAPEVRREVLLAAGRAPETVVKTDNLLHWLHDSDEDVRRLCESVLNLRGMTREQVKLGRMLTHGNAVVRLQVPDALADSDDVEPGVWLRMLSVDPEPAVRIAAVRFAAEHPAVDLSDRLDQMAHSDPSPTVQKVVQTYLKMPKPRRIPILDP